MPPPTASGCAPDARGATRRARLRLQVVDLLVLATAALFAVLAVLFQPAGWRAQAAEDLAAAAAYLLAVAATRQLRPGLGRAIARTGMVSLACAYLFGAVAHLQLILHGRWLDGAVLALQEAVFATQPTLWVQRFVRPWLTEWLMFAYVIYIALYALVPVAIYLRRGEGALEECLLALALANVACDLGFILFPVAGPSSTIAASFTVPLRGYVFTAAGELVRSHLHFPGGSLPSPHAAAATVLWLMAWKHRRGLFWLLAPLVLSLDVATFYCRYHYLSDTVAGIATAAAALAVAPALLRRPRAARGSQAS